MHLLLCYRMNLPIAAPLRREFNDEKLTDKLGRDQLTCQSSTKKTGIRRLTDTVRRGLVNRCELICAMV